MLNAMHVVTPNKVIFEKVIYVIYFSRKMQQLHITIQLQECIENISSYISRTALFPVCQGARAISVSHGDGQANGRLL